jgi:hypothetical protein
MGSFETGLGVAAAHQPHQFLRGAFIVAHDAGFLFGHRTHHLSLARSTACGFLASIDVAHDCHPSLDWGITTTRSPSKGLHVSD